METCKIDGNNVFVCVIGGQIEDLSDGLVLAEPPMLERGQAAIWTGSGWELVLDYRGRVVYSKATAEMMEWADVGDLPAEYTLLAPPEPGCEWGDGEWILPPARLAEIIEAAKASKLAEVNAAAQAFIAAAAETYKVPDFEQQSWALQAAEAKAWAADSSVDTPLLNQIAASRGVDADKLKAAAWRKTLAYEQLIAHVAGRRQAVQSRIELASNIAELNEIRCEFSE